MAVCSGKDWALVYDLVEFVSDVPRMAVVQTYNKALFVVNSFIPSLQT